MPKTSNDDAYIPPLPDTHPAPWQWNINPAPVSKDDFRFPSRWKKVSPFYPTVNTDRWIFNKFTPLENTMGRIQSVLTNYHAYKHAESFVWEQNLSLQNGYFQDPNYKQHGPFYIPLNNEISPAAPESVGDVATLRFEWGFFQGFTLKYGFELNTYFYFFAPNIFALITELSIVVDGNKVGSPIEITNPDIKTRFECYNQQIVFKMYSPLLGTWLTLHAAAFDWNNGYDAGYVQSYDMHIGVLENFGSLYSIARNYLHDIHLTTNRTYNLSPIDYISVFTPLTTAPRSIQILTITPNLPANTIVKYQKNGQNYNAYYDSVYQYWRADIDTSVSDFRWLVYSNTILESFTTAFQDFPSEQDFPPEIENVLFSVSSETSLCEGQYFLINIMVVDTLGRSGSVEIRFDLFNRANNQLVNSDLQQITKNIFDKIAFPNPPSGDYVLRVFENSSNYLISEVYFSVRKCGSVAVLGDRSLMLVGLSDAEPIDGRAVVSTSDADSVFVEESGAYEKKRI